MTSPSAEAYKCPVSPRWQMSRMPPPSLSSWASITFLTFPNLNICPGPWLIVSTDPLCEAVSEASVVQTLVYNIFQTLKYASSAKLLKCYFYVIPLSNPLAIAMIDIFSSKFTFIPNICKRSKDSDLQTKHLAIKCLFTMKTRTLSFGIYYFPSMKWNFYFQTQPKSYY